MSVRAPVYGHHVGARPGVQGAAVGRRQVRSGAGSGEEVLVLDGDEEGGQIAFSPDGSMLATVGGGIARIWALDIDDLLGIARENVTRSLTDEECRQYLHVDPCPAQSDS